MSTEPAERTPAVPPVWNGRDAGDGAGPGRDFVILLSKDGDVLEVNRGALDFTGWKRSVVIGRPIWAVATSPEVRQRLRGFVERAAAGQEIAVTERVADRDGRLRELEMSLNPVARDESEIELLILVARDVTGISDSLRRLVDSRDKYFGIVNIAADAIISVDDRYRITDFNNGAEQIFGYTSAEMLGRSLDVLIPGRFRSAHVEHLRRFGESPTIARRMGERREISAIRKDGKEFPADASISKQDVDGQRFYSVVLRDMTIQRRAERTQRILARAGSLLASSLDVATTLDSVARLAIDEGIADCCVIFDATEAQARRVGLECSTSLGFQVLERHRGESLSPESRHPVNDVLETGEPRVINDMVGLLAGSGEDRDIALIREIGVTAAVFVPLVARGRTGGAIALYRTGQDRGFTAEDLSLAEELGVVSALAIDNARLYESATRAIRARDDILAVVSHDLGNPVAAVRISTTVLERQLARQPVQETAEVHLRGIRKAVDQMDRLIRDLLDAERIEVGPLALGAKPVRPATVVSTVIELFNGIALAKPVSLRSRMPASLPTVRADRERLVQALSNLVGNAIKFTRPRGNVEVAVEPAGDMLVFSVNDDGPGIDPANLEHIFDRFWKAARRDTGAAGGLGLGLAIVKGIVQAHGGRVWAESQPGQGASIRFAIPVSGPVPAARRQKVHTSPTGPKDIP